MKLNMEEVGASEFAAFSKPDSSDVATTVATTAEVAMPRKTRLPVGAQWVTHDKRGGRAARRRLRQMGLDETMTVIVPAPVDDPAAPCEEPPT